MNQTVVEVGGVKRVGQFTFSKETPDELILVLLKALQLKKRVRLFYGDRATGVDWLEEFDTLGYIGTTQSRTGAKALILLPRKDSTGGGKIPTGAVLKVTVDKLVVYQAPNYVIPRMDIVPVNIRDGSTVYRATVRVFKNGSWQEQANFGSTAKARAYVNFITGAKNTKS